MSKAAGAQVEVLVIGAGPSGLMAAVELARNGIPARVIEHEAEPHGQARATAIQPATLEILARAGMADRFLAASVHLMYTRVFDAGLLPVAETRFAGVGADCRWRFQCSLPQWRTERILSDRLAELGGAVERGVAAVSLDEREDDVLARLEHADGRLETVSAQWVIGAGGAHSVTRESMAETLAGSTYRGTALVADVRVSCVLPRDGSALIASPAGYVMLAPLPHCRWLTFIGDLADDEVRSLAADQSPRSVEAAIGRRIPDAICVEDVAWAAPFQMHRRLVPRLADRRRFLLGDAGHLSSPFGGEGLNSGLHDANNLAWKLALVSRGRAGPALLASFAAERHAADEHVLAVSDELHQLAHAAVESARSGTPATEPSSEHAAALVRARTMLDVSYAASPLTGEYPAEGAQAPAAPGPGDRYPGRLTLDGTRHHLLLSGPADQPALSRLRARWSGLVNITSPGGSQSHGARPPDDGLPGSGLPPGGALLIRPDGYIGFRATTTDAGALAALDTHLASYLIPA